MQQPILIILYLNVSVDLQNVKTAGKYIFNRKTEIILYSQAMGWLTDLAPYGMVLENTQFEFM